MNQPISKIESDDDLDRAIEVIDSLLGRGDLDRDEAEYLDALGNLVEEYETEHHPIADASGADVLRLLIESNGMTQSRLASETGISQSTVSEVLAGKRLLNRRHIEILCRRFRVSPAVFIQVRGES